MNWTVSGDLCIDTETHIHDGRKTKLRKRFDIERLCPDVSCKACTCTLHNIFAWRIHTLSIRDASVYCECLSRAHTNRWTTTKSIINDSNGNYSTLFFDVIEIRKNRKRNRDNYGSCDCSSRQQYETHSHRNTANVWCQLIISWIESNTNGRRYECEWAYNI